MTSERYQSNNIFAQIIAGAVPCHKVYEDENTLVFLDIAPASRGHCLVVPKVGSRNIFDIKKRDLAAVMIVTQKIAKAQMNALGADGVTIRQNNEVAGGQEVFHTHFHVMPRYKGKPLGIHDTSQTPNHHALAEVATILKKEL